MAGGDIETYLLEKSRVTYQSPMERCYHIFYFMITHKVDLHESCMLSDDIYDYPCVSMGKVLVDSIDDVEEMFDRWIICSKLSISFCKWIFDPYIFFLISSNIDLNGI